MNIIERLVHTHIESMGELEKASVKYFLETGKVNGSFMERIKSMMKEAASLPQSSKTFYCWHKEATGEDICKHQCKDCSGCKGSEEISNIIPQSSTEEEKGLIEKLKYVDHVLSDDGYQSESEIRSIVKDVMNYFKRNL